MVLGTPVKVLREEPWTFWVVFSIVLEYKILKHCPKHEHDTSRNTLKRAQSSGPFGRVLVHSRTKCSLPLHCPLGLPWRSAVHWRTVSGHWEIAKIHHF